MNIKITQVSQFRDEFHHAGRGNQFSYDGLAILFNWLEENYKDYDLDVVELCCEYAESTIAELVEAYSIDGDVMEYVNENTLVLGVTSTDAIVYAQF